ncbi:MAG: hypothetical protein A3G33_06970 [Omnitrophica bacterium RIFCSPLOWO2_12_FULL_44_17]|uniref:DUF177 domain-containing protein n=1 Tax=Candidatus Danuiimicrobium aquiferis TaxID=1801832 RepID=A0A1G1KYP9_9BACT|nr:MAG: hypothetical protein A3B72_07265 [Omnitrophica bacterium RIFCSPHIGHO2_02_FULL_45_28]OGW90241.1 MAG: hypothetical protein A3E74_07770 [Omnitrophica bacterium RIFCSPHIGHO2_12_FULL_44_12]OGW97972.1 MAG: hypothetical protein A3G33_06970 [Omnitrophica bacterium RIFCSPLOWO2_12_FULL_44_17]OGX02530.1 MAG: hypothetical protein A3J12_04335 [Omnitrophica bacterium RIFCSPLOWO2_02_FULL_44_11]
MIFDILKLKEGIAEEVSNDYNADKLDLGLFDIQFKSLIHLEGIVEKVQTNLLFRGNLSSQIEQVCARCLCVTQSKLTIPFDLCYEIAGMETLNATNDLRDYLILDNSDRFICKKDCKGICPTCGVNLNEADCYCKS